MRSNWFIEKEFQFSEQMLHLNLLMYFRRKFKLSNNSEKNIFTIFKTFLIVGEIYYYTASLGN